MPVVVIATGNVQNDSEMNMMKVFKFPSTKTILSNKIRKIIGVSFNLLRNHHILS